MNFDDGSLVLFALDESSFSFSSSFSFVTGNFIFLESLTFDARWDTKDDANDQDNGFVCKRQI